MDIVHRSAVHTTHVVIILLKLGVIREARVFSWFSLNSQQTTARVFRPSRGVRVRFGTVTVFVNLHYGLEESSTREDHKQDMLWWSALQTDKCGEMNRLNNLSDYDSTIAFSGLSQTVVCSSRA
ncbi:hypothetical protein VTK26DRAFT_6286 [Humicola hyalothermophila]